MQQGRTPEDVRKGSGWVSFLRWLLWLANLLLAAIGVVMVAYAGYMWREFRDAHFHGSDTPAAAPAPAPVPAFPPASPALAPAPTPALKTLQNVEGWSLHHVTGIAAVPAPGQAVPSPWFIYAFGGAGAFTLLTALTGLIGARGYRWLLALYSFLMFVLLAGQFALAVAYFADDSWKKKIPHDDTGEAEKIEKFIEEKLTVVRWVGLAVLVLQLLSVALAWALSSAQQLDARRRAAQGELAMPLRAQAALEAGLEAEEEDAMWGRRRPLLARSAQGEEEVLPRGGAPRSDAWSMRMRTKYGLDTSNFTYDPERRESAAADSSEPAAKRSYCTIM